MDRNNFGLEELWTRISYELAHKSRIIRLRDQRISELKMVWIKRFL
jgi:hypothetical protein